MTLGLSLGHQVDSIVT